MAILPLHVFNYRFMSLPVEVRCGQKKLLEDALPFVVDTAAQRTFISMESKRKILRAADKIGVSKSDLDIRMSEKPALYVCGKLYCENIYALRLLALELEGGKVSLDGAQKGVSVLCEDQKDCKIAPPNVNVIGMDVLSKWTLVREPYPKHISGSNYPLFFLTNDGDLRRELRRAETLGGYFKHFRQHVPTKDAGKVVVCKPVHAS